LSKHHVTASSFADPADVLAFRKWYKIYRQEGHSHAVAERRAFAKGDNGIGAPLLGEMIGGRRFGVDTTADKPMCALPPDDWKWLKDKAPGALVRVKANGREVVCELRDTLPWKKNISNGCGIDLNPAACRALDLFPPVKVKAVWEWVR
jgi:hypothetical protein